MYVNPHQQRLENLQRVLEFAHSRDLTVDTLDVKDKLRRAMVTFVLNPSTITGYVYTVMNVLSWEKRTGRKGSFKDGLLE
jgi:hypothetical protein